MTQEEFDIDNMSIIKQPIKINSRRIHQQLVNVDRLDKLQKSIISHIELKQQIDMDLVLEYYELVEYFKELEK